MAAVAWGEDWAVARVVGARVVVKVVVVRVVARVEEATAVAVMVAAAREVATAVEMVGGRGEAPVEVTAAGATDAVARVAVKEGARAVETAEVVTEVVA